MKRIFTSAAAILLSFLLLCGANVPAFADAMAPIAENAELCTYRNTSVGGQLTAYNGDGKGLRFELLTKPVKGDVELQEDGSFVYTPRQNKKGKDYFGFRAVDSEGRSSQEATVIITINKQKTDVSYSDMDGEPSAYAALLLEEKGIYTGQKLCGRYVFCPNEPISRGDFLAMCMTLAGKKTVSSVMFTDYADDDSIPDWMKGYVAAAAMDGFAGGSVSESGTDFCPTTPVSRRDAQIMLDRALGLKSVAYGYDVESEDAEWLQACANLNAYGIIKEGRLLESTLTRGEAAMLLASVAEKLGG